ncbi:MAG: hypothetical protein R3290_03515 [Acidimicrobiia bacterium]|nr:hypothetical protein [Acidimicrobiia bacterium]
MAVAFVLLGLLVQVVGLVAARHRASSVAAAAALDASLPGADPAVVASEAAALVRDSMAGARSVSGRATTTAESVTVSIRFRWVPPGPDWVPVWVGASATATRVRAP